MPGWTQQGAARSYDASNLFEYMDGNSEGYLLYGFAAMHGVTCVHGGDSILIDISELRMPIRRTACSAPIAIHACRAEALGAGGQVTPRRVIFTKDRYYVELAANPDKDHTPALRAFCRRA